MYPSPSPLLWSRWRPRDRPGPHAERRKFLWCSSGIRVRKTGWEVSGRVVPWVGSNPDCSGPESKGLQDWVGSRLSRVGQEDSRIRTCVDSTWGTGWDVRTHPYLYEVKTRSFGVSSDQSQRVHLGSCSSKTKAREGSVPGFGRVVVW